MSKDINSVILVGRLTRDPEISYTKTNMVVCKFSIAVNGYRQDEVNFFNITVFDKLATNCQKFLKKGSQASIKGSLKQDRWQDKNTHLNRSAIGIIANEVQFLGGNKAEKSQMPENKPSNAPMTPENFAEEGFHEFANQPIDESDFTDVPF